MKAATARPSCSSSKGKPMAKQKILIVDDDANISELITLYLTKEFFETKCAGNGEEALALAASFRPDLIRFFSCSGQKKRAPCGALSLLTKWSYP